MPANYQIDHDDRIVFSRAWGNLTNAELLRHQEALLLDPAFDPTYAQLWEFQDVSPGAPVSVDAVQHLAGTEVFAPWARRAFVTSRPMPFKLARIFAILRRERGELGIEVFCDLEAARAWIGLA